MGEPFDSTGGDPMIQFQMTLKNHEKLEEIIRKFGSANKTWWYREKLDEKNIKSWSGKETLHRWDIEGRIFHSDGELHYRLTEGAIRVVLIGNSSFLDQLSLVEEADSQNIQIERKEKAVLPDIKDAPGSLFLNTYYKEDEEVNGYFWTAE
jgi:hypothetical protein